MILFLQSLICLEYNQGSGAFSTHSKFALELTEENLSKYSPVFGDIFDRPEIKKKIN
jgi:hypothetical protein